jgi:hypothetical protein
MRRSAGRGFYALALLSLLAGAAPAEEQYTDTDRDDALTCRMLLWVTPNRGLMMKLPHKEAQAAQARPELPIPSLASDRPLELNRFLDGAADARRPPTVCALHVVVSAEGTVDRLSVRRSTGAPPLDAACLAD